MIKVDNTIITKSQLERLLGYQDLSDSEFEMTVEDFVDGNEVILFIPRSLYLEVVNS